MSALSSFWRAVNTLHAVVYFAPDAKSRYEALGLKGYWMGYFASRGAALGTPGPELVTATFHGFAPDIVARALPDAWSMVDRDALLAERAAVARDALAPGLAGLDVTAMTRRLAGVAAGLDVAGKPLAAAQSSLAAPQEPLEAFWHHLTVAREFRGDCHVAVLVAAGLDGVTSNVLQVAVGKAPEGQRQLRGWSEERWAAGEADLRARGWIDDQGVATETGRIARERIEDATHRSCEAFMATESTAHAVAVSDDLVAAARAVLASGNVAFPNPTGTARP